MGDNGFELLQISVFKGTIRNVALQSSLFALVLIHTHRSVMNIDWDILPLHVKERIIGLLDASSLVMVACVSRAWAETALAQKWSRASFTRLLRVFSSQTMLDVGPSTPMVRIWLHSNG